MSRFYVGQKVRVVRLFLPLGSRGYDEAMATIGKEGVVDHIDCWDALTKETGMIGLCIDGDSRWCFRKDELEPITDSYDLVSWESMRDLWVPDHMRTKA